MASMVATYQPNLLLVELGFNDIGWFVSDAYGLLNCMGNFINNARAARSDLQFAIANVPQRTFIQGRDDLPPQTTLYNNLLANAIAGWTRPSSPVVLVDFAGNYNCKPDSCPAGHDGLHPNSLGEYQIASAFTKALVNDLHIGSSPLSVPSSAPARPCPVPSNVVAKSSPDGIAVTWDAVYGAFSYDLRSTNVGAKTTSQLTVSTTRWDTTWTQDGWEWEYQVRTNNGAVGVSVSYCISLFNLFKTQVFVR